MVVEQAEGGSSEDVGGEVLLSVLVLEGLLPVDGGEFQDAADRPAGQEAEKISEVGPGLHVVELAAGEEGDEGAASGMENHYDGRGYVMLTWWDNYVRTGFMIGVGLDLLFTPDLTYDPKISYKLISIGMLTGQGFANRHKFKDYFDGNHTDYVGARAMVNGTSGQHEIAGLAERFERVLRASSPGGTAVGGAAS